MRIFIIVLLFSMALGVAILAGRRYIDMVELKVQAEREVSERELKIDSLDKQLVEAGQVKQALEQKNALIENSLKEAEGQIIQLSKEREEAEGRISYLMGEIDNMQVAFLDVNDAKFRLEEDLNTLKQQNAKLHDDLSSIDNLKMRIRELKVRKRKERLVPAKTLLTNIKPPEPQVIGENSGFLIKEGQSTYKSRVEIEVNPAQD